MRRLVEVGDEVKDQITGFKGIAMARTNFLYGCVRIEVQPQKLKADKNIEESVYFDETQLIVIKKQAVVGNRFLVPSHIQVGDEVKDIVTGYKGIANCTHESLFGYAMVSIQPQGTKDGKIMDPIYFNVGRIEVLKKNKIEPTEKSKEAIKTKKSTGGPSRESIKTSDMVYKK